MSATSEQADPASARATRASTAVVVPHTHWDREWHSPYATMRFHLVEMLDELLDVLEAEPELPAFLLDGQAVILEDYVGVRPDQRERLQLLVSAGRLRPGPFYVQPDMFLVSGESIVRNVLHGLEVSTSFGGTMREGYLPDTFGHVHQLPQILQGFGIPTFFAMRGLGADVEELGSEFWWEAVDGSRVRAHALIESYSNAAVLTGDPDSTWLHHGTLVRYDSLHELLGRLARRSHTGVLLLLNGGDHLRVQGDLPRLVASLDQDVDLDLALGTLEDYRRASEARDVELPVFRGELRSGRYHDVFEDITSTRTYLKRANDDVETDLLVGAERLDAVVTALGTTSLRHHLRVAWRELLKNHAHDSVTGCSVDAVHEEMQVRFRQAEQIASAVTRDRLSQLTTLAAPAAPEDEVPLVVVNPSPWSRTGPVSVGVLADLHPPLGQRLFGWRQRDEVDWSDYSLVDDGGHELPFTVGGRDLEVEDMLDRRKELWLDDLRFVAHDVPALGWRAFRLVPRAGVGAGAGREQPRADTVGHGLLENEHLRVAVHDDGTVTVTDRSTGATADGLGELVDEGDAGDEYNAAALPDRVVRSRSATWEVVTTAEPGVVELRASLQLPEAQSAQVRERSERSVACPVTVRVSLPPGARHVRFDTTVDNRARDHRLRVRLPFARCLADPGGAVLAESAFGSVRRGPRHDDDPSRWKEQPAGTFAMRRFVAVEDDPCGWAVLTHGLHEYGRDEDGALLVTLLRAVGQLSRSDIPARPHPAGPPVATPGAQCLGEQRMTYAVMPFEPAAGSALLLRAAEELAAPLLARAQQPPPRSDVGRPSLPVSFLELEPPSVALTAFKAAEHGDGIVARIVNCGADPVEARLVLGLSVRAVVPVALDERPSSSAGRGDVATPPARLDSDGTVVVPLRPGEIATVRLDVAPMDPPTESVPPLEEK
jgi:mannosylglycerate hydrolase